METGGGSIDDIDKPALIEQDGRGVQTVEKGEIFVLLIGEGTIGLL